MILGSTGRNFAAGMSGGVAFVLDAKGDFAANCNMEMVALEALTEADAMQLHGLVQQHYELTESDVAQALLADWAEALTHFTKVMPVDYKQIQTYMQAARDSGKYQTEDEVTEAAFQMHIEFLKAPKKSVQATA